MRLLVCGGRDWKRNFATFQFLGRVHREKAVSVLIHGAAPGADTIAGDWAKSRGIPVMEFPANWDFYGKQAGGYRNAWMIEFGKPQLVIAFPGGRGTTNMIERARLNGVPVREYDA